MVDWITSTMVVYWTELVVDWSLSWGFLSKRHVDNCYGVCFLY